MSDLVERLQNHDCRDYEYCDDPDTEVIKDAIDRIKELEDRERELEEEKPDAAEIIELRKACAIYQDSGITNRKRIKELEGFAQEQSKVVADYKEKGSVHWRIKELEEDKEYWKDMYHKALITIRELERPEERLDIMKMQKNTPPRRIIMSDLTARAMHLAAQENNDSAEYNIMVELVDRVTELEAREPLLIERELLIIDKLASEFKELQAVVDRLAYEEYNSFGIYTGDDPVLYLESELDGRIELAQQHATKEDI